MSAIGPDHGQLLGVMAIICTDRGQHKRTRLADVRWYADGYWHMTWPAAKRTSFRPPTNKEGEDSNYVFDCPRCTRTPYFSRAKWVERVEGKFHPREWGSDGGTAHADFDVSEVPF